MKSQICIGILFAAFTIIADTVIVSDSPTVVRNAEIREAIRQDLTWTSENIQKNPYLFLQDQIASCDRLRAKIEAQLITLSRMEKKSSRTIEESKSMETRYSTFLEKAKTAYKANGGKWPVTIEGYELGEEEFNDKWQMRWSALNWPPKNGPITSR